MEVIGAEEGLKSAGPFDGDDGVLADFREGIVGGFVGGPADGFKVGEGVETIGVDVDEGELMGALGKRGIFVGEDEGGTGDGVGFDVEALGEATDPLGFAGAEIAVESEDVAGEEKLGQGTTQGEGGLEIRACGGPEDGRL